MERNSLPHCGVYTRLRPSIVHKGGVGVFAIRRIPKGTSIFFYDEETETIEVRRSEAAKAPAKLRKLYEDFCIVEKHGRTYRCPKNFNLLTPSWYLNEPKRGEKPNVGCGENYLFHALRDIEPDEELTVDYDTYNEFD